MSVKLPDFQPNDPELWLQLVESAFVIAKVDDELLKFNYVATHLSPNIAREVRDVLMNKPAEKPYSALVKALKDRLCASQETKIRQLLEREDIGDSTPSQFLRRLRTLANTAFSDDTLKAIWTSRLPQNIRGILATQAKSSLDDIATLADKVVETMNPQISAADGPTIRECCAANNNALQKQIDTLTAELASLKTHNNIDNRNRRDRNEHYSRARSNSRTRSNSRVRPQYKSRVTDTYSNSNLCWYHIKFGANARKCTKSCGFRKPSENHPELR